MDIDIDVDDILWSASKRERQELYDGLVEEFGSDNAVSDGRSVKCFSDAELTQNLDRLYENKDFLNEKDKAIIYKLSKKGLYDEVY